MVKNIIKNLKNECKPHVYMCIDIDKIINFKIF